MESKRKWYSRGSRKNEAVPFVADKGISRLDIPNQAPLLQVLSKLLTIRSPSGKTAWGRKGQYFGGMADTALQSLEPGRNRPCAGRLESRFSGFGEQMEKKRLNRRSSCRTSLSDAGRPWRTAEERKLAAGSEKPGEK